MVAQIVWRYGFVASWVLMAGLAPPTGATVPREPIESGSPRSSQIKVEVLPKPSGRSDPASHAASQGMPQVSPLAQSLEAIERETDYWLAARRLLAERLRTIATIRRALLLPDPEAIAAIDFDLYRNHLATDRFLREFSTLLSADSAPGCYGLATSFDDIARVYCALANTQIPIQGLFDPLSQQQAAIADLPPSAFLSTAIVIGTPAEPDRLAIDTNEPFDAATPLPGVTAKPPLARIPQRYTPPAYSPPPALIDQLDAIATPLQEARRALPNAFAITLPDDDVEAQSSVAALPASSFSVPNDYSPSHDASPDASPDASYDTAQTEPPLTYIPPSQRPASTNPTGNRVLATPSDYAPLISATPAMPAVSYTTVPGLPNAIEVETFVPSLLLEIASDAGNPDHASVRLEVVSLGFDFGAIAEIDAVDLDALSFESALARLDPALRSAFADYRPPELFADLHADRQRARLGKNNAFGVTAGVATSLPAIGDRVYLFRSIQYDLPEFIETGRSLYPSERRELAQRLDVPSFDGVIAVELLDATAEGGYQVRWRLLEQFPEPQITDLYNYVNYGDARSPSW